MALRTVAVILQEPVALFEYGVLAEVFGLDRTDEGVPAFEYRVCSEEDRPLDARNGTTVSAAYRLDAAADADLVAIPASPAAWNSSPAVLDTIRAAPSAAQLKGGLTAAEQHGKDIFESAETGCTACHAGAHFTDNVAYDIGSKSNLLSSDIRAFQTPVLHGLRRSAPYFHDGKYQDLEQLVEGAVRTDKMGVGSHLSDADAADLVAYLQTL